MIEGWHTCYIRVDGKAVRAGRILFVNGEPTTVIPDKKETY